MVLSLEALFREAETLIAQGVPVFERLRVSPGCPLILPSHAALDRARESASGGNAIGTTGRGIGPAYEDKVARRAVHVADLYQRDRFAARLGEMLDFHNFVLQRYFGQPGVDFQRTLDEQLQYAERLRPLLADVTAALARLKRQGANVLFEGAQGAMLDVDVGTYPFVTSSNTIAGAAATGTGLGPCAFDEVLGIMKAYATRVGGGPFPTELFDEQGEHLSRVGKEFGAVTGRRRRCGWFDAVALRRAIMHSGISSLCMTKLDVLDGLDTIRVCVAYRLQGETLTEPPLVPGRLRRDRAGLRGDERLARKHGRHHGAREAADQCTALCISHRRATRDPARSDLNRSGSRTKHRPATPVREAVGEPVGEPVRPLAPA